MAYVEYAGRFRYLTPISPDTESLKTSQRLEKGRTDLSEITAQRQTKQPEVAVTIPRCLREFESRSKVRFARLLELRKLLAAHTTDLGHMRMPIGIPVDRLHIHVTTTVSNNLGDDGGGTRDFEKARAVDGLPESRSTAQHAVRAHTDFPIKAGSPNT